MNLPNSLHPHRRLDVDKLLASEGELIEAARPFGLNLKKAPQSIYSHLMGCSPESIAMSLRQITDLTGIFHTCTIKKIDPWDDTEFFLLSMRSLGLSFPKDFLDYIAQGDLIEGYDMDRRQIFRNMAFMQHSGYSLVEMLSFEWPALFDRSTAITQKMITFCDDILWAANRTIPFDIPNHYLRERQSSEQLMWEVEFRHLAPLFSGPNKPFGLLGSCRVKAVELSNPIEHLSFV